MKKMEFLYSESLHLLGGLKPVSSVHAWGLAAREQEVYLLPLIHWATRIFMIRPGTTPLCRRNPGLLTHLVFEPLTRTFLALGSPRRPLGR